MLTKTILVLGPTPRYLGGFHEHNPIKAYVKEELVKIFKAASNHVDVRVYTTLSLGVGVWAADAARLAGVKYSTIDAEANPSWTESQHARFDRLYCEASSHEYSAKEAPHVKADLVVLVGNPEAPTTPLLAYQAIMAGAAVMRIDPEKAPFEYRASMALETLRGLLPGRIDRACIEAQQAILEATSREDVADPIKQVLLQRLTEVNQLASTLKSLRTRL